MKIIFFGTPDVCIPFLDALRDAQLTPSLVVTAPDKPAGRGNVLTAPPVKQWAQQHNIAYIQPEKIHNSFVNDYNVPTEDTTFVVVAYGYILPETVINAPQHNTINVHFSLLPRWRGASPVESALLAGDTETGCAIQLMQPKLDTGPVIALQKTGIKQTETAPELRARLSDIGATLLVQTLTQYDDALQSAVPQDDTKATYAHKMQKSDGNITNDDDLTRWKKYRAYAQWPQTYFFVQKGNKELRVKVTAARFENNQFIIDRVIPEGKKEMAYADFLRGTN